MSKEVNVWDIIRGENVPTKDEINHMINFAAGNVDCLLNRELEVEGVNTALDPFEGNIHKVVGRIIGARSDAKDLNKSLRLKFKDLLNEFKSKLSNIDLLTCTEGELLELGFLFGKIQAISNLTNDWLVTIIEQK